MTTPSDSDRKEIAAFVLEEVAKIAERALVRPDQFHGAEIEQRVQDVRTFGKRMIEEASIRAASLRRPRPEGGGVEQPRDLAEKAEAVIDAAHRLVANSCWIIHRPDDQMQVVLEPGKVENFSRVCSDALHELREALSRFDSPRGGQNGGS